MSESKPASNIGRRLAFGISMMHCAPKTKDADKKRKAGRGAAKRTPFLPPQMGNMPRLRKFGKLGQYLFHARPELFLPLGYILQVGVINAPGLMRPAG